ncbi:hypothetical protein C8F01DRAFT_1255361 [Mycena amicta]|nr:hypothetical protein C8F01DRAFT_1255361 [Mycena amicta]
MTGVAPILPPELERRIFELAAWDDQETISTLNLVARRGYIWIEPLRHRVIRITSEYDLQRLWNIVDRKPESARHIHYLAIVEVDTPDVISRILRTFSNLTDLGLWGGETVSTHLAGLQTLKHLKRLSVNFSTLLGDQDSIGTLALLTRLTHLEIFGVILPEMVPALSALPALTHLSFFGVYTPDVIERFLATCSGTFRLMVLVHTSTIFDPQTGGEVDFTAVQSRFDDPRFAIVFCGDFVADWTNGAWEGYDYWCRAEEEVAARAHALQNNS